MSNAYHSFMIRFWRLSAGERRIMIQHLQTGEQARVLTLEDALVWLGDRAEVAADAGPHNSAPPAGSNPTPAATAPKVDEPC